MFGHRTPYARAKEYIDEFYSKTQTPTMIKGKVMGNHGEYTVSFKQRGSVVKTACSCYVGRRDGDCHHCDALAWNYLQNPESFKMRNPPKKSNQNPFSLSDLPSKLEETTLEDLIVELKKKGISQKAFAESIGMSSRHLSLVKKAEGNNRFYHELGATKLACLYVLERLKA